jgi:cell division protein FtsB
MTLPLHAALARVATLAAKRGRRAPGPPEHRAPLGLTPRGVLLLVVLFALGATAVYPLREYASQRARIGELQAKQAALAAENARLERERDRLQDPSYLSLLARRDLNLVEPGEQPWLLTGNPPAAQPPPPAAPAPQPKRPWYQRVWARLTSWAR